MRYRNKFYFIYGLIYINAYRLMFSITQDFKNYLSFIARKLFLIILKHKKNKLKLYLRLQRKEKKEKKKTKTVSGQTRVEVFFPMFIKINIK